MKRFWVMTLIAAFTIVAISGIAYASMRYYDTDYLDEGQYHTITLRFQKGATYMVVAAASQGTVDFDLTATDPEGNEIISSDSEDNNTDWIRFTSNLEGNYKIKISAYKGSGWYELMVLDVDHY